MSDFFEDIFDCLCAILWVIPRILTVFGIMYLIMKGLEALQ